MATIGQVRFDLPLGRWLAASAASLLTPAVAAAQETVGDDPSLFECSACVGFRTLPYWGPVVGGILLATAFFLFVYRKPFPTLPEEGPEGPRGDGPDAAPGS